MSGVILKPRFRNKPILYKAEAVGPIGDVHQIVKLKHSCPELPLRFEKTFSTARVGQNVQDGDSPSYNTGWYGAESIVLAFDRPANVTTAGGFTYQDIVPQDRLVIPETMSLPSYSWENLKAETYKAQISGQQFLPLPGPFAPAPGSVPRGGATPQIANGGLSTFTPMGAGPSFNEASYYDKIPETGPDGTVWGRPQQLGGFAKGLNPTADIRQQFLAAARPQGFMNYA